MRPALLVDSTLLVGAIGVRPGPICRLPISATFRGNTSRCSPRVHIIELRRMNIVRIAGEWMSYPVHRERVSACMLRTEARHAMTEGALRDVQYNPVRTRLRAPGSTHANAPGEPYMARVNVAQGASPESWAPHRAWRRAVGGSTTRTRWTRGVDWRERNGWPYIRCHPLFTSVADETP